MLVDGFKKDMGAFEHWVTHREDNGSATVMSEQSAAATQFLVGLSA